MSKSRVSFGVHLRPVSVSDQSLPCSHVDSASECNMRATFLLLPSCACDKSLWPNTQSCPSHLARVVRLASARCQVHFGARTVRVMPL